MIRLVHFIDLVLYSVIYIDHPDLFNYSDWQFFDCYSVVTKSDSNLYMTGYRLLNRKNSFYDISDKVEELISNPNNLIIDILTDSHVYPHPTGFICSKKDRAWKYNVIILEEVR